MTKAVAAANPPPALAFVPLISLNRGVKMARRLDNVAGQFGVCQTKNPNISKNISKM